MFDIVHLKKVIADGEDYVLHLRIKKATIQPFIWTLNGLKDISEHLAAEVRRAEAMTEKAMREYEREKLKRFEKIKQRIREGYKRQMNILNDSRKALKITRKAFIEYWFLVAEFREELRQERDMKIVKMNNQGADSAKIAERLNLHPVTVRKVISRCSKSKASGQKAGEAARAA